MTSEGSVRWIGDNFRSGGTAPPRYYDVAEFSYRTKLRGATANQTKRYYFDSGTKLLSKVAYRQGKARGMVAVESEFSDWTKVNGQAVPRTLIRREDGVEMLRLTLTQVAISVAANDSLFGGTGK